MRAEGVVPVIAVSCRSGRIVVTIVRPAIVDTSASSIGRVRAPSASAGTSDSARNIA